FKEKPGMQLPRRVPGSRGPAPRHEPPSPGRSARAERPRARRRGPSSLGAASAAARSCVMRLGWVTELQAKTVPGLVEFLSTLTSTDRGKKGRGKNFFSTSPKAVE